MCRLAHSDDPSVIFLRRKRGASDPKRDSQQDALIYESATNGRRHEVRKANGFPPRRGSVRRPSKSRAPWKKMPPPEVLSAMQSRPVTARR